MTITKSRHRIIFTLFILCVFFQSCAVLNDKIKNSLELAGTNCDQINIYLSTCNGEEKKAAEFLVANMPAADLCTLTTKDLVENSEFAFKARRELPWGEKPAFNIFLHYVLPYRVTQEAFNPWRANLYNELKPVVSGLDNMVDAALAINRWCGQRVRFVQTEFRDQSVRSTIRAGYGRCEEMMITAICALRAMGLPARACSTPWWAVNDNNHAWVEVWADGAWRYLGGCEGSDALNKAWFRGPTQRAGMVLSAMFGSVEGYETGERVCRIRDKSAVINSTAVYSSTGRIDIEILDEKGAPASECPASISIFNFGGLRPLLTKTADTDGKVSFYAGMGEFFVAAGKGDDRAWAVVKTKPEGVTKKTFKLSKDAKPPESFWLRFPTVPEARRMSALIPSRAVPAPVKTKVKLPAKVPLDLFEPGKDEPLDKIISTMNDQEGFSKILKDSKGNWRILADALKQAPESARGDLHEFLKRTTHLDRIEISAETISDHVVQSIKVRPAGLKDDIYNDHILKAGIYLEHLAPWRRILNEAYHHCLADSVEQTIKNINAEIAQKIQTHKGDRYAPMMNPAQVHVSGWATPAEAAVYAVGILRSIGIPARKKHLLNLAEFHDNDKWISFDPLDISAFGETGGEAKAPASVPPGVIRLKLTLDNKPLKNPGACAVAPFRNGGFAPLRQLRGGVKGDEIVFSVPAGEYLVSTGARNPNGDPWILTKLIDIKPSENISIAWRLDLPDDEGIFKFPIVRKLEKIPELQISGDPKGEETLQQLVDRTPLLIIFYLENHEPSTRMLPLIANAFEDLEKVGVEGVAISLPAASDIDIKAPSIEGLPFSMKKGIFDVGVAFNLKVTESGDSFESMPSILLLSRGGKPILWTEGYDLKIEQILRAAARMVN